MIEHERAKAKVASATRDDVEAETWPPRYRMHKYWGRKPANVVSAYVAANTSAGELVIDPFAGSGVTIVEAARLGRRARGFDVNPFAVRLSRALFDPPPVESFVAGSREVLASVRSEVGALHATTCDACGSIATIRSVAYDHAIAREVRYRCGSCGATGARAPSTHDRALFESPVVPPTCAPDAPIVFGWQMRKLRRARLARWSELFSPRNFAVTAHLRRAILEVPDARVREWLLLTLTASLAQCTRMIADFEGAAGGPSWKLNSYWLPGRWQELNPLWYFENRVRRSAEAIVDLSRGSEGLARVDAIDSRRLPLADASVDYVFTDPPYGGEGVQYGELSVLWCLWLGETPNLDAEIAENPVRKLDAAQYARGLGSVFAECHRVLRPGRAMTVTFANKDERIWNALVSACVDAGFRLEGVSSLKRSAPSLNETNGPRAPKEDLVLRFTR